MQKIRKIADKNLVPMQSGLSDGKSTVSNKVSELTSDNVRAVKLAQLASDNVGAVKLAQLGQLFKSAKKCL